MNDQVERCPVCNQPYSSVLSPSKAKLVWVVCPKCKSLFHTEAPSAQMLFEYYSDYYNSDNLSVPQVAVRSLERTVSSFEPYRSLVNSICDIGFGAGSLLEIANGQGWKCSGTEYSTKALEMGLSKGWDVHEGNLVDGLLEGPFDVLTIIETLEHVYDPLALLKEAKKRLRVGGLLYGTTPNASSINRRILGENWNVVSFPEHPILLSKKALYILLKELGFVNIEIFSAGLNPFDLLRRVKFIRPKNRSSEAANNPRVEYGYRLNETMTHQPLLRIVKLLINYLLKLTHLGDGLVFRAERSNT